MDASAGLELTVRANQLNDFMREFRDSNRMRFQFPGTGARDWNIGLNGSMLMGAVAATGIALYVPMGSAVATSLAMVAGAIAAGAASRDCRRALNSSASATVRSSLRALAWAT